MGVNNLWKALVKEDAVKQFVGATPGHHAEIIAAVENKVVAVDLSAWLMQAQTQPALLEHYDSPYARAYKVVFDRTIHWLRYGCLPVFVIEGKTPAAKLAKLQQRCVAQYGPTARSYDVGNRAGGQFDKLGQAVRRLLDAFGVPCVQAVGEGEAMCAALNLCGWAHACHTLDVDALLFGALTVYRQMHLQTDDPRKSTLVRCDRSEVQRVLGIKSGGDAALVAVAQLAGGDYDTAGAEQVGENLALAAVRCLLRGCEDDETVLQKLEAALAAGPDPELDALTQCTGCKACGHEGGMKSRIKQHTNRHGGCAACGTSSACIPRDWMQCECAFHRRADDRLLNRVVRRAVQTPGFVSSCRTAAATYSDQLRQAIAAVQREYGLPNGNGSLNVFSWRCRPDSRLICELTCKYIKDWDHNQVRLKLLPLLLEWDVRQGPSPSPSAGVQFRPTGIRKVSSKGAEEDSSLPARQQQGWRYVLLVERLQRWPQQTGDASNGTPPAATHAGLQESSEAEDLAIDLAWIAGTARSKPQKAAAATASAWCAGTAANSSDAGLLPADWENSSQACYSQYTYTQADLGTQGCGQSTSGGQAACSGGSRSGGSLQFSEHRSVRCSLVDAVWPEVVASYRAPPAADSGHVRSGSTRRKASAGSAAAAVPTEDKQRSLKDFFGTVKDYTATAKPSAKREARQPATDGSSIPGLAGIGAGSTAAEAVPKQSKPTHHSGHAHDWEQSTTKNKPVGQSFMDWLDTMTQETPGQQSQQQQQQQPELRQSQQDPWGHAESGAPGSPTVAGPALTSAAAAARSANMHSSSAGLAHTSQRVFVGARSGHGMRSASQPAAGKAGGAVHGCSQSGRGSGAGKHQVMRAGALEKFLQPVASAVPSAIASSTDKQQQQQETIARVVQQQRPVEVVEQQQQQHWHDSPAGSPLKRPAAPIDCCSDSPEVLPLAARLQARSKLAGGSCSSAAAEGAAPDADAGGMVHPAKKVELDRAKELFVSPSGSPASQQLARTAAPHCATSGAETAGAAQHQFSAQYAALLEEVGASLPDPCRCDAAHAEINPSKAAKGLFGDTSCKGQAQQQQHEMINLVDSDTDSL